MSFELSIIIPARREEWLPHTINDVLANTHSCTEVIAVLDGEWPFEPLEDHPRLRLIHHSVSIGQRAAINKAARLSTAKYICKLDAHCRVDQDFDIKLMANCEPNDTVVPRLYNLHVFDWKCKACGVQTYQGPEPTTCATCKASAGFERVLIWQPRWTRKTDFMRFDETLKFKYWGSYGDRPEVMAKGDIADTMSLLGACFFMTRSRFWALDGCDEMHGSWGQQGTEVAIKSHLSRDGRLVVNKNVWYSHLFRTQPGFGFPYSLSHDETEKARIHSRELWLNNRWPKAVRPLSSMIDQYWPIPGWSQESLDALKASETGRVQFVAPKPQPSAAKPSVGIVFYTDNRVNRFIGRTVRKQIMRAMNGHSLVSVSLKPLNFGTNITLNLERGALAMHQQILAGLSELDTDYVFLAEHDVLYSQEHFQFLPPRQDVFYYDTNVWKVSAETGQTLHYNCRQLSGLCADRQFLLDHIRLKIEKIEREGWHSSIGFEPGTRGIRRGGVDDSQSDEWQSSVPIVDIRHDRNFTKSRWKKSEFRDQKYTAGWTEGDSVPGWPGITLGRFNEWLAEVAR